MRIIEVRRHTMRIMLGQHLSQQGVNLARDVGRTTGPFARVITSPLPRAFETAIAMGFAVNAQVDWLKTLGPGVEEEVPWDAGFAAFARAVALSGVTAEFARVQFLHWKQVADSLDDGLAALLITHGGIVEAGAVAALPDADHTAWGRHCDYCEGVRLYYDGRRFVRARVLRVAPRR